MIEINLSPENLRRKTRAQFFSLAAFNFPKEVIIGLVGGFLVILFIIHFFLQIAIFVKFAHHKFERKQWERLLPQKAQADITINELRSLQSRLSAIDKIKTEKRIFWSQKLNNISDLIPRGVWLNKISFKESILLIDGSAVSKMKDEMVNVGNFVSNLKSKDTLIAGLQNIELGSIQRRQVKLIDVVDFIITAKLK